MLYRRESNRSESAVIHLQINSLGSGQKGWSQFRLQLTLSSTDINYKLTKEIEEKQYGEAL